MRARVPMLAAALVALVSTPAPARARQDDTDAARAVEAALERFRSSPSEERLLDELRALGKPAGQPVCARLEEARPDLPVVPLVLSLGSIGSVTSVATLERVSASPDEEVRLAVVQALSELALLRCIQPLVQLVDDESDHVAARTGERLLAFEAEIFRRNVIRELMRQIADARRKYRHAMLLADMEDVQAREGLHELTTAWHSDDVNLAALAGIWHRSLPGDGSPVHDLLYRSESVPVRKKAALTLGKLGYPPAVRDLIDLLAAEEPGLVIDAHWALEKIAGIRLKADPELWEAWWQRVGRLRQEQDSLDGAR